MRNHEFREWLRGFFDLSEEDVSLAPQQIQVIVNHLNLAEAVEGNLDLTNQQMRLEINAFRGSAARAPEDFRNLTFSIQQLLLSA